MKVEILGIGCAKCAALETNVRAAVEKEGIACEIAKITDLGEIMARGVMRTPALLVDGKLIAAGNVPESDQILQLMNKAAI